MGVLSKDSHSSRGFSDLIISKATLPKLDQNPLLISVLPLQIKLRKLGPVGISLVRVVYRTSLGSAGAGWFSLLMFSFVLVFACLCKSSQFVLT